MCYFVVGVTYGIYTGHEYDIHQNKIRTNVAVLALLFLRM